MSTFLLHSNIFVCMRGFVCSFHCCHLPSRPICPLICESCVSCKIRRGFLFLWGKPRWTLFKCLFLRKSFCILENIQMYQRRMLTRFHLFPACVWRQILVNSFVGFVFCCWSWAVLLLKSRCSFVCLKICAVLWEESATLWNVVIKK